ncbi:MAG: D-alanine--D-alanine ligase [Syntrophomonadaceae bacterium]|nr:D-alanine--D-alanine ligase [Syntrophomonadaceae bacterium]
MKKIAVLCGGTSSEREVSLRSGEAVYQALLATGYSAVKIDANTSLIERLFQERPDAVFIALHGKLGEDGTLQGLLDIMGIPYTGPGVLASAIGMNKLITKKLLSYEGIPTPPFISLNRKEVDTLGWTSVLNKIKQLYPLPLVVKPIAQGSTIGVFFVHREDDIIAAVKDALSFDSEILVEKMIKGTEVTASIMGDNPPVVLPLIEITSVTGIYDYQSKYTPGMSQHIIPPNLPETTQKLAREVCLRTYQAIGCRGYARVDCIIDANGQPFVLEINTAPGLTATSLFPDAARHAGIEFPELVRQIVEMARTGY